jgi:hypothetical protein
LPSRDLNCLASIADCLDDMARQLKQQRQGVGALFMIIDDMNVGHIDLPIRGMRSSALPFNSMLQASR